MDYNIEYMNLNIIFLEYFIFLLYAYVVQSRINIDNYVEILS